MSAVNVIGLALARGIAALLVATLTTVLTLPQFDAHIDMEHPRPDTEEAP